MSSCTHIWFCENMYEICEELQDDSIQDSTCNMTYKLDTKSWAFFVIFQYQRIHKC